MTKMRRQTITFEYPVDDKHVEHWPNEGYFDIDSQIKPAWHNGNDLVFKVVEAGPPVDVKPERYRFHIQASVYIDALSVSRPGSASTATGLAEWLEKVLSNDKKDGGAWIKAADRNVKASVSVTREEA